MTIAGERAAEREDVRGPGTFLPALIDEVWKVDAALVKEKAKIMVGVSSEGCA